MRKEYQIPNNIPASAAKEEFFKSDERQNVYITKQ